MSKQIIWIYLMGMLASCTTTPNEPGRSWPDDDQISITWKLLDDAPEGDDKRTSLFTINNHSDQAIMPGWKLYFSHFPTTFYVPASAENRYDLEMLDGDLARISTLDSLASIQPGKSLVLSYQWPVRMIKNSHAPHGLFFVLPDQSVHDVATFTHEPVPASFSFETKSGPEPIHITAKKRYELNQSVDDIKVSDLAPILPTPLSLKLATSTFRLVGGGQIHFDAGLEQEADHLVQALQQVLQGDIQASASSIEASINLRFSTLPTFAKEGYQLTIAEKSITITGSDPAGIFYGIQSLKALIPAGFLSVRGAEIFLPQADIKDAPRFAYRGQLLDVARNFLPAETIKKVIQLMASYKLNKLHFHLTDDEGWRLEIPDLPELTEIGARRGFSANQNDMLPPAYGSGGQTALSAGTGNGYYSREDFIDILKFANAHHVDIIPEINGPGHARAAIKAMQHRYDKLMEAGDEAAARAYLLHDRSDESPYTSAQNYHDNVICVCQENTYTFLEKVVAEVVAMYKEAGAPLPLIHTGGDEVPHGAWTKSPECERLIRDEPELNSVEDLHPYFVGRYIDIADKYAIKIGGWEEISLKAGEKGDQPNPEFVGQGVVSYAWNAKIGSGGEDMAYQLANAGYEVVMANASNLYFDQAYNYEPEEPGLYWAGYVDTKNAFELTPSNIFLSIFEDEEGNILDGLALSRERVLLRPGAAENIIGIQGALWGEVIKSADMLEYALLPKLFGLAERAWSLPPVWTAKNNRAELKKSIDSEWAKFANRIGKLELPRLDYQQGGFAYRISPPGAIVENGILRANIAFPGLQIRYTLDGTDPDINATLYEGPVDIGDAEMVKIRAFTSNKRGSRMATIDVKSQPLN